MYGLSCCAVLYTGGSPHRGTVIQRMERTSHSVLDVSQLYLIKLEDLLMTTSSDGHLNGTRALEHPASEDGMNTTQMTVQSCLDMYSVENFGLGGLEFGQECCEFPNRVLSLLLRHHTMITLTWV